MRQFSHLVIALGLAAIAGCAHAPTKESDPETLLKAACEPGATVKSAQGSIWLKASSKDASGQFPAVVTAKAPSSLKMEVTNLIGATEAIITVEDRKYKITVPNKKQRNEEGYGSWAGIPLQWATDLFLGKVPCPPSVALKDAKVALNDQHELVVDTKATLGRDPEQFVFGFRNWEGRPWPESLKWERKGTLQTLVEFKFDQPEDGTRSPLRWDAKSPQGEVKVRWKNREMSR